MRANIFLRQTDRILYDPRSIIPQLEIIALCRTAKVQTQRRAPCLVFFTHVFVVAVSDGLSMSDERPPTTYITLRRIYHSKLVSYLVDERAPALPKKEDGCAELSSKKHLNHRLLSWVPLTTMKQIRTRAFAQNSCSVIPYQPDVLKHQHIPVHNICKRVRFSGGKGSHFDSCFPTRLASLRSLSLEEEDGAVAEVEVDEVLRLCRHQGCVRR